MLGQHDIAAGLQSLGLARGDTVLLHSALSSLGRVDGGAATVVKAFLEVLGPEGTLVAPIFGPLGVIADTVRDWPGAVRSAHPLAGVAAIGANAQAICADHWRADTAHGAGTPYTRIAELGGYVCLLGVDQDRNTTLHTVETMLELAYLNDRTAMVETPAGPVEKTWRNFPGPHRDFIGVDRELKRRGILKIAQIGGAAVRLMKSRDMIDACHAMAQANPALFLCDNSSCSDCLAQKGKLRQALFDSERFTLAASGALAGRYVPEMVERLDRSGIRHVELDFVEGMPVDRMPSARLERLVERLRDARITVVGLRSCAVADDNDQLCDKAASLGVPRIVAPLSAAGGALMASARDRNIHVSFYNHRMTGQAAASILHELTRQGHSPGFTFNPAGFVESGQAPFATSFKTRVKRFIDQVDICDRTFDGADAPLAHGNAEIKELISILRCSSFSGIMVLGGGVRTNATLPEAADRLAQLIEAM